MDQILSDGKNLQNAKSGVLQGSVIGPLLFLLFVNDLSSAEIFADDVKMVSPRSQSDLLQSSLSNVWNWSIIWDLPINPTKCNYIAIGRAPPLQLSLAIGSLGNSIQVADVVKDLSVLMDSSFSPSVHCIEAASKARRKLFMIRRSFAELFMSAFTPLYNTLVHPHLENTLQICSPNRLFGANPAVSDEARKGFPLSAIWGATSSAGSALPKKASPPWRPHSRIRNVFWWIRSGSQPLFYSASAGQVWEVILWKCCRFLVCAFEKVDHFNTRRKKLEQAPYFHYDRPFSEFIQAPIWFGVGGTVCWGPVIYRPSILTPSCATPFYIIPIYAFPTPIHCPS